MTATDSLIPQEENTTATATTSQTQVVETLIANKKKSSNKQEIAEFTEEWSKLVHKEGMTNETMTLLVDGFSIAGAAPLFTLMSTDDSCLAALKEIRKLSVVKDNNLGATLRVYVHLFALAVNAGRSRDCINSIVSDIPRFACNKEGKPFGTNSSTVSKYLLRELDAEKASRVLSGVDLLESTTAKLVEVFWPAFEEAISKKKPVTREIEAVKVLREWLDAKAPSNIEGSELKNPSTSTQSIAFDADENENSSDEDRAPGVNYDQASSSLPEPISLTYDSVVTAVRRLEQAHSLTESRLSTAKTTIKTNEESISNLKASVEEANTRIDALKGVNLEKQQQIDNANHQISTLQRELEETRSTAEARSEMIMMLDKNRDQKGGEVLARIASKLKADYGDFKEYEGEPMTAELGEIVKLQLSQVFETLKSSGVKL